MNKSAFIFIIIIIIIIIIIVIIQAMKLMELNEFADNLATLKMLNTQNFFCKVN